MPNEKDRKKKDHGNAGKKNERMREAVKERHEHAHAAGRSTDQGDIQTYKSGSPSDRPPAKSRDVPATLQPRSCNFTHYRGTCA